MTHEETESQTTNPIDQFQDEMNSFFIADLDWVFHRRPDLSDRKAERVMSECIRRVQGAAPITYEQIDAVAEEMYPQGKRRRRKE